MWRSAGMGMEEEYSSKRGIGMGMENILNGGARSDKVFSAQFPSR
ncbi:hypothetical protein A2U01_0111071 [Trifolium medium]|uniref:Uncharacterized protein n=1 Tax=Trifolium medium TaxID=97028 RepID=A0A392VQQ3_9FABA|nr:hypothetical protein [Trifolium medium]